jgi:hypothetical protein
MVFSPSLYLTCGVFPSRMTNCSRSIRAQQTADTSPEVSPLPPPASSPALPPPRANQYSSNEIIDAGHHFFGGISRGLASIVERAVSQWGLPNGYILGEEASGASV